jgi:serine/threonine-protein kinase
MDMALISGDDLSMVLTRDGALAPARAVTIIEHVAAALDVVHRNGLIHCAVAASIVLFEADDQAHPDFCYLSELGEARFAAIVDEPELTDTEHPINAAYVAPEPFP